MKSHGLQAHGLMKITFSWSETSCMIWIYILATLATSTHTLSLALSFSPPRPQCPALTQSVEVWCFSQRGCSVGFDVYWWGCQQAVLHDNHIGSISRATVLSHSSGRNHMSLQLYASHLMSLVSGGRDAFGPALLISAKYQSSSALNHACRRLSAWEGSRVYMTLGKWEMVVSSCCPALRSCRAPQFYSLCHKPDPKSDSTHKWAMSQQETLDKKGTHSSHIRKVQ